jgi:hypothetical protein
MADETKIGTDWRDVELDAIVADYFEMLEADCLGSRTCRPGTMRR